MPNASTEIIIVHTYGSDTPAICSLADVNTDGVVDDADLLAVLSRLRRHPEQPEHRCQLRRRGGRRRPPDGAVLSSAPSLLQLTYRALLPYQGARLLILHSDTGLAE